MNKLIMGWMICAISAITAAQDTKPIWELGKNQIDPATVKGKVEIVDGVVKLDGTNSFSIPKDILGNQRDYAIEFEIKKPSEDLITKDSFFIISNMDSDKKTGIALNYRPLPRDMVELHVNGNLTYTNDRFLREGFQKITIVAKDGCLTLFRNGLVLAITEEIKPSDKPLSVGDILKNPIAGYELSGLKIYDKPFYPEGSEQKMGSMMRNYSGDQYLMQRVEIKDKTLPRILVVGDSISGGYRPYISEHFKGRAYVDYWTGSGWFDWTVKENDFPVLRAWSGVLSNGPYDVVSWNSMTLHMWGWNRPERCNEERYPAQMTRVLEHLKKAAPDTKFIWVRCTPYSKEGEDGSRVIDVEKSERIVMFNEMTDDIMKKYHIPKVDLYALCEKNQDKAAKDSIHWYEAAPLMAKEIIAEIEKMLSKVNMGDSAGESK